MANAPLPTANETTVAILGALVVSIVIATIITTSPIYALRVAYTDYSKERVPESGGRPADMRTAVPDAVQPPAKP